MPARELMRARWAAGSRGLGVELGRSGFALAQRVLETWACGSRNTEAARRRRKAEWQRTVRRIREGSSSNSCGDGTQPDGARRGIAAGAGVLIGPCLQSAAMSDEQVVWYGYSPCRTCWLLLCADDSRPVGVWTAERAHHLQAHRRETEVTRACQQDPEDLELTCERHQFQQSFGNACRPGRSIVHHR